MTQPTSSAWAAELARARRDYATDIRRHRAGWPSIAIYAVQRIRFAARLIGRTR